MMDEQATFAGVPIPLTMETVLDAMADAISSYAFWGGVDIHRDKRGLRQYHAFRDRILRIFDFENNAQKIAIESYKAVIEQQKQRIAELEQEVEGWSHVRQLGRS